MMTNEKKFNGKSEVYSKYRPDYPDQLVKDLVAKNKLNKKSMIADIGSGTGIMTAKLLNLGIKVFAVEPNKEMRNTAIENLKDYKGFFSVSGSAENTTIDENSIDLIVVAQAFHWFNVEEFRKECQRILKPSGIVALVSNERLIEDEITKDIAAAYRKYCPDFKGFSNGLMDASEIYDTFFEEGYTLNTYDNPIIYTKSSFIDRHLSSSFSLKPDDEFYPMLVESLRNIFERHEKNGYLTLSNITKCRCGVV